MWSVRSIVIIGTGLIAGSAAAYVLAAVAAFASPVAALFGLVVLAGFVEADRWMARRDESRRLTREIATLKRVNVEMAKALEISRNRMVEIASALETQSLQRNEKIIAELRVLESLVRGFADRIQSKPELAALPVPETEAEPAADIIERRAPVTAPGHRLSEDELLDAIRDALEDNRVDLYLQPIVALPQRRIRFYEAFSRLRAADGAVIMPAQYLRVAEPAGLMPVIDNLLLFRCVQVVRRLTARNRSAGIVCNISSHSLSDAAFFPQFLEFLSHNRDLAGQIVFEFAQSAFDEAGPREEANLRYLAGLGFTFSMDRVAHLDLDFARIRERGVRYIKVPADTLLNRMAESRSAIAAADLKDLLERHGLELVVEKVERERTVAELLDYNVAFGQGYLFGEPKPIRETALDGGAVAAGAAALPQRKTG